MIEQNRLGWPAMAVTGLRIIALGVALLAFPVGGEWLDQKTSAEAGQEGQGAGLNNLSEMRRFLSKGIGFQALNRYFGAYGRMALAYGV
jgi:hypothetical protein